MIITPFRLERRYFFAVFYITYTGAIFLKINEILLKIIGAVNSFAWGPVMLALLICTGIYLTFITRFIQIRKIPFIFKNTIGTLFKRKNKPHKNGISPFEAVSTALGGTVGTGNIAGVTGAVLAGGPGAVLWMWVSAFFGMCTKYAEILLAVKYRRKDKNGKFYGGPMYYIRDGLDKSCRLLSVLFAVFGTAASFGIGNIAQTSEIAGAAQGLLGAKPLLTGIILAVLCAVISFGGAERIGKTAAALVPFMSLFYIFCALAVITINFKALPSVAVNILKSAFSFKSLGGGLFGYGITAALKEGFSRGVFSNEAGLGSAPIAHAAADTDEPCMQALWGVFEVFCDTVLICSMTAFAVLVSLPEVTLQNGISYGEITARLFDTALPGGIGTAVIRISIILFAFTSLLGWSYYGQRCLAFLTCENKAAQTLYKTVFAAFCIVGAVGSGRIMWEISDALNGLMALPNLTVLLFLSPEVGKETKRFFNCHNA